MTMPATGPPARGNHVPTTVATAATAPVSTSPGTRPPHRRGSVVRGTPVVRTGAAPDRTETALLVS
ncbi:hypothetical protein GCM10010297_16540 [Streptomyces malachitofuscus]|nr:hypothetical protein GCM10010297_16540 [Streptomyces malachitofuscus]